MSYTSVVKDEFFGGADSYKYELSRDADMSSGEILVQPLPLTVTSDHISNTCSFGYHCQ